MIEPYYDEDGIQVFNTDALALLRSLDDSSVDLVATDPPYFKVKGEAWDNQWDKPEAFLAWIGELCAEWRRVLKPNGSLYVFASPKMAARVEVEIGKRFNVLNRIRWVKDAGWHNKAEKEALRSFLSPHEEIVFAEQYAANEDYASQEYLINGHVFEPLKNWFRSRAAKYRIGLKQLNAALNSATNGGGLASGYFGKKVEFQLPTEERYRQMQSAFPEAFNREYEELRREYEELRRPFSVTPEIPHTDTWRFPTVQPFQSKHVCEKPLALMEHILSVSGKRGCLVLDCFAGSGTTLQAAKNLGMRAIGSDIGVRNCQITADRLRQQVLFTQEAA